MSFYVTPKTYNFFWSFFLLFDLEEAGNSYLCGAGVIRYFLPVIGTITKFTGRQDLNY